MPSYTTILGLYEPGGGSTGSITPDEVVDVDKLNQNFRLLDAAVGFGYWATGGRPPTPFIGQTGYNSTLDIYERWNGSTWVNILPASIQATAGTYYTQTQLNNGQLDNRYYTQSQLNNGQLDSRYYTQGQVNSSVQSEANARSSADSQIYSNYDNGRLDGRYPQFGQVAQNYGGANKIAAGNALVSSLSAAGSGYYGYVDVSWSSFNSIYAVVATAESSDGTYPGITVTTTNLGNGGARLVVSRRNNYSTGIMWVAVGN